MNDFVIREARERALFSLWAQGPTNDPAVLRERLVRRLADLSYLANALVDVTSLSEWESSLLPEVDELRAMELGLTSYNDYEEAVTISNHNREQAKIFRSEMGILEKTL